MPSVQSLKLREDAIGVLRIKADAVVNERQLAHGAQSAIRRRGKQARCHLYPRRRVEAVELQRIRNQVLNQLPHLKTVGFDCRQLSDVHTSHRLLNPRLEIGHYLVCHFAQIGFGKGLRPRRHSRQIEEIANQDLHALGGILHARQIVLGFLIERAGAGHTETFAERQYLAQGFLQIMGSDEGKIL